MQDNRVELKEIIELFVYRTIDDIKSEEEVPKINFLFANEDLHLFEYVKNYPFKKEGYWTPNIEEEDIKKIKPEENKDESCPTVVVQDALTFFDTLTKIINSYVHLSAVYGIKQDARFLAITFMRRIWLRMGEKDFTHVEDFLQKQLEFIDNEKFDQNRFKSKIAKFHQYDVMMHTGLNATYDETTRNMQFSIVDEENNSYQLPYIYYEIDNDDICYIYAVQNKCFTKQNKKIERLLYKLNKGIENPNIHPNRIYAMLLFINYVRKKGITQIKIPKKQVLSYRYHQLLSEKAKSDFEKNWSIDVIENLAYLPKWEQERKMEKYEYDRIWYSHVVGKENTIHKAKTEGLFNLIDRMQWHIFDLKIDNNIDSDCITMYFEKNKKLNK